jgi:hypothetical protein
MHSKPRRQSIHDASTAGRLDWDDPEAVRGVLIRRRNDVTA